jgi:hypothetical protein
VSANTAPRFRTRRFTSLALLLVLSGALGALVISSLILLISFGLSDQSSKQTVGIFPPWFVPLVLVLASFVAGAISGGFAALGWITVRALTTAVVARAVVTAVFGAIGGELCFLISLGGTIGAWEGYAIAAGAPAIAYALVTWAWSATRGRLPARAENHVPAQADAD